MDEQRKVKGIWIPIEVWKNKNLSWNEKILLMEIDSYTSETEDCYFSNKYISEMLGVNETTANKLLSNLIKQGFVTKTRFDGRHRYVRTNISFCTGKNSQNCAKQPCTFAQPCLAAECNPENILYNNTSTLDNNISNKKDNKKEEDTNVSPKKVVLDYQAIIDCWNEYNGKSWGKVLRLGAKRKRIIKSALDNQGITQEELMRLFKTFPYADSWLFHPTKEHKDWKPDFDWWMRDTNGWLTKALEGKVHNANPQAFNDIMQGSETNATYAPQGRTIWYDELTKTYWTDDNFYYGIVSDGYTDDNRPDGATLTMSNARGVIIWDSSTKKWEKK